MASTSLPPVQTKRIGEQTDTLSNGAPVKDTRLGQWVIHPLFDFRCVKWKSSKQKTNGPACSLFSKSDFSKLNHSSLPSCLLVNAAESITFWGISGARMLPSIFFFRLDIGKKCLSLHVLFCTTLNFCPQHATLCSVIYSAQILHFLIF